ncbi:GntR family transcriptional regulator [Phreatobacter stygius]|uniref:GntR family transcriptional regulator n=2 Tax=Phreatobacter stygius TaxID=1940610 RepID=A0A4D7BMZ4_9HYPH|nr:GntR family transcriptional regulator [Phreatobacter stygius]
MTGPHARGRSAASSEPKLPAHELVREGLREAIMSGEFESGTLLRQDALAERFGTSRIPVREALQKLEAEGLVRIHPNRGAVVTHLSLEDVLELMDIRIALECRALTLAIPNMTEEDTAALEEDLRLYDQEEDPRNWPRLNWKFHQAIYAACDRPKLISMIESNVEQIGRFTSEQVSLAAGKRRPQEEHWNILEACKQGNAEKAARLLQQHIQHTQKSLLAAARREGLIRPRR